MEFGEKVTVVYKGLLNNESWEGRLIGTECWNKVNLGDAIHSDWEYRKVNTWLDDRVEHMMKTRGNVESVVFKTAVNLFANQLLEKMNEVDEFETIDFVKSIMIELGVKVD